MPASLIRAAILSLGLVSLLPAQIFAPEIPRADLEESARERMALLDAVSEIAEPIGKLVFPLAAGPNRIGHALSIGGDRVLAKWSDCEVFTRLLLYTSEDIAIRAKPIAVYPEHDLVILKAPGLGAPTVRWGNSSALEPGSFLAAIDETGTAVALGVMSVENRSLRTADQGFLGVSIEARNQSSVIGTVEPASAAEEAGLRPGDVILRVNNKRVVGFHDVQASLRRLRAGSRARILIRRKGRERLITATLGERDIRTVTSRQIRNMNRMSGTQSEVRDNFPEVIQTDLSLEAYHAGMPVIDLEGKVVGIVIARAGRISTLMLPASVIQAELRTEPHTLRETPLMQERKKSAAVSPRVRRAPVRDESLLDTIERFVR